MCVFYIPTSNLWVSVILSNMEHINLFWFQPFLNYALIFLVIFISFLWNYAICLLCECISSLIKCLFKYFVSLLCLIELLSSIYRVRGGKDHLSNIYKTNIFFSLSDLPLQSQKGVLCWEVFDLDKLNISVFVFYGFCFLHPIKDVTTIHKVTNIFPIIFFKNFVVFYFLHLNWFYQLEREFFRENFGEN